MAKTTATESGQAHDEALPAATGDGPAELRHLTEEEQAALMRAANYVDTRGFQPATADLIMYIAARAMSTADLNVVIVEQMAARFAVAQNADDILDPFGTVKGEDLLGQTLYVVDCGFLESDIDEGFPWYVSLAERHPETGASRVVTVGGEKLVLQAAAMDRRGLWPQAVKIFKAEKATKAGFFPLELRKG